MELVTIAESILMACFMKKSVTTLPNTRLLSPGLSLTSQYLKNIFQDPVSPQLSVLADYSFGLSVVGPYFNPPRNQKAVRGDGPRHCILFIMLPSG